MIGPVERVIPVNDYISGYPSQPEAILYGVAMALGLVDKKVSPVQFEQLELSIPNYYPKDLIEKEGMVVYQKIDHV